MSRYVWNVCISIQSCHFAASLLREGKVDMWRLFATVKLPWKVVEECVLALIIPCHRSDSAFLLHGRRCSRHCRLPSMYLIIFKVIRDIFRYLIPGDRVKLKDALLRVSAQVWQEFIISVNIVFEYMKYVYRDINWWEDGRRCCLEM